MGKPKILVAMEFGEETFFLSGEVEQFAPDDNEISSFTVRVKTSELRTSKQSINTLMPCELFPNRVPTRRIYK